jgi:hypothetical protein
MTIGICERCKRECHIYNPNQEVKLCNVCYSCLHANKEKSRERVRKFQTTHRAEYNKYMRDYQRKKLNIPPEKWRKYGERIKPVNPEVHNDK